MSLISTKSVINSLLNTIKCHINYIEQLKTPAQYRGAVTDDRIILMEAQIKECEETIANLRAQEAVHVS